MTVEIDHAVEVFRAQPRDAVGQPRTEVMDVDGHPLHTVEPFEAVGLFDREPAARRSRQKHPRFVDRLAEDRRKRLRAPRREARAERQTFHDEHDRLYLPVAPPDPPARALDVRLIDVRERIRR